MQSGFAGCLSFTVKSKKGKESMIRRIMCLLVVGLSVIAVTGGAVESEKEK